MIKHNMTKTTPSFALLVGTVEILLLSLTWVVNPDYVWNPINGVFKSFSFVSKEALLPDNTIDDIAYFSIVSYGVGCLSTGLARLLAGDDVLLKKALLRVKFWLTALTAYNDLSAAFASKPLQGLNPTVLAFWGGMTFSNALWLLSDIIRHSRKPHPVPRTKPTYLQLSTLWVNMSITGFWVVCIFWNPDVFEPGKPLALLNATPNEDNTFSDIHYFGVRCEGIPLLASCLCGLEIALFDPSVEAIRAINKFSVFALFLYETLYFSRNALGNQYINSGAVLVKHNLIYLLLTAFLWKCGPPLFESPSEASARKEKKERAVPDLVSERAKKAN